MPTTDQRGHFHRDQPVSRHAYTLHATDGRTDYSPQNWIQRGPDFPARGLD
jgi:phytanoyl-CoA hydroxylase